MSTRHRPLSDWVARVLPTTPPTLGPLNDGTERADARTLARFDQGWVRHGCLVAGQGGGVYQALGLQDPGSGETVVELDNYGEPLPADDDAVALIDRIERQWPLPDLSEADLRLIAGQAAELRYLLLSRLTAETDPPHALFHILPWSDVEAVCRSTISGLQGGPVRPVPELGHVFTPAVVGVTGPLEQLHLGLTEGDRTLVRLGSAELCRGLYLADVRRLPPETARTLADLLALIGARNPFLSHIAAVAASRLTGGTAVLFTARLTRQMPASASDTDVRYQTRKFADDSAVRVTMQVDRAGMLSVTIDYALPDDARRQELLDSYESVFHQVLITTDDGVRPYWVPIEVRRNRLSGSMRLSAPERFGVQADLGPVGVRELADVVPEDLRPSLWAANNPGRSVWRALAARLPEHHPVTLAVRAAEGEGWR